MRIVPYALLVATLASLPLRAQSTVDSSLQAYINGIKAIDNHAHPLLPPEAGVPPDTDNDALPLAGIPDFPMPYGLDPTNPRWIVAWRALYGYRYNDESDAHVRELVAAKAALAQKEGDQLANWMLDRMGTETMLANRVAMGRGLEPPRFRWVSFVDALLFPSISLGKLPSLPIGAFSTRARPRCSAGICERSMCPRFRERWMSISARSSSRRWIG